MLLGVLFSLSLAAYGLLIGGVALYIFYNTKRGMIYVTVFSLFIAVVWIISINYNSGENYLNKRIFERLIFEDGEMMGANRTTDFFKLDLIVMLLVQIYGLEWGGMLLMQKGLLRLIY